LLCKEKRATSAPEVTKLSSSKIKRKTTKKTVLCGFTARKT